MIGLTDVARAVDQTVLFDISGPGEYRSITEWGLDTAWPNYDNMRRGLAYMGDQVDLVRIAFPVYEPLNNGELGAASLADVDTRVTLANMAGADVPLAMAADTGAGVHGSYKSGNQVIPSAWAEAMEATVRAYEARGKTIVSAAPFNEPDFGWNQGTMQNLYDICVLLQSSSNFANINLAGGSTLNCDAAGAWYDPIKSVVEEGTTHQLAGSFNNYVSFYQNVIGSGDKAVNEELHNVCEVIVGAEYGLETGIWWGTAELARASFIEACQGMRLGYAEDRPKWTAAAVYRAPDGDVQGFVGESERQALPTTYRFFSKDRDVFYDGYGPQRAYSVTTTGGPIYWSDDHRNAEKVVNITWGDDVQPVINGRYIVVNRSSSRVMQVANGSLDNGANILQYLFNNALYQQWDVVPLSYTNGGDYSYYSITAAHSGKAADLFGFSYDDGGDVKQWENVNGVNQHWFLQYAGDGWFYIRNRWSGKYLETAGTQIFANIRQGSGPGGFEQQWRLIPVGNPVEFVAPAPPTGLTAAPNALSVQLSWNASPEPDLAGYTVLRGTNSGGPYDIIARGLTNNVFTDNSANRDETLYYVVRAVDGSLNRSGYSEEANATPTLGPGLVARYGFDGNMDDSSVNKNHAIVINGSPTFVPGQHGFALDLDGTSQYTMLPANLLASVANFTIALWVSWDGGDPWQRILDFGNETKENMFLTPSSGDGTLRFAITTNGSGGEEGLDTLPLPIGEWWHVAVTRNGNTARLYTNGVLAVSGSVSIAPASFDPALNYLGDSQYTSDSLFDGRLDELFIYNYALSDTEIQNLMNNQPPPPNEPTRLATSVVGNTLGMAWPANYLGSRLESNAVSLTATGQWFTVPGSASTNQVLLPFDGSSSNVFFRLVYP